MTTIIQQTKQIMMLVIFLSTIFLLNYANAAKITINIPTNTKEIKIYFKSWDKIYLTNKSNKDLVVNIFSGKNLSDTLINKFILKPYEKKIIDINLNNIHNYNSYNELYYVIKYFPVLDLLSKEKTLLLTLIISNSTINKYKPILDKILIKIKKMSKSKQQNLLNKILNIEEVLNTSNINPHKKNTYLTVLEYLKVNIKKMLYTENFINNPERNNNNIYSFDKFKILNDNWKELELFLPWKSKFYIPFRWRYIKKYKIEKWNKNIKIKVWNVCRQKFDIIDQINNNLNKCRQNVYTFINDWNTYTKLKIYTNKKREFYYKNGWNLLYLKNDYNIKKLLDTFDIQILSFRKYWKNYYSWINEPIYTREKLLKDKLHFEEPLKGKIIWWYSKGNIQKTLYMKDSSRTTINNGKKEKKNIVKENAENITITPHSMISIGFYRKIKKINIIKGNVKNIKLQIWNWCTQKYEFMNVRDLSENTRNECYWNVIVIKNYSWEPAIINISRWEYIKNICLYYWVNYVNLTYYNTNQFIKLLKEYKILDYNVWTNKKNYTIKKEFDNSKHYPWYYPSPWGWTYINYQNKTLLKEAKEELLKYINWWENLFININLDNRKYCISLNIDKVKTLENYKNCEWLKPFIYDKSFKCLGKGYGIKNGFIIVDSAVNLKGCYESFVKNKYKCIVKIWDFYVSPAYVEKLECKNIPKLYKYNNGDCKKTFRKATITCNNFYSIIGIGLRRLPTLSEMQTMYNNKHLIYDLHSWYYWSKSKNYRTTNRYTKKPIYLHYWFNIIENKKNLFLDSNFLNARCVFNIKNK